MRGPNNEEFNNSLTVLEDSESLHSHDRTTYFVYIPETKEKKDYEIIGKECLQKQFSEYNKSNFVLSLNRIQWSQLNQHNILHEPECDNLIK